jgi:hypothetical protein
LVKIFTAMYVSENIHIYFEQKYSSFLRGNVSKILRTWNLEGRKIILRPFLSDSDNQFQLLGPNFGKNFRFLLQGGSKLAKIDVNFLFPKFHPFLRSITMLTTCFRLISMKIFWATFSLKVVFKQSWAKNQISQL